MIRYLTGASNRYVRDVAHSYEIGLLITPNTGYRNQVSAYPSWACDNGAFKIGASHRDFDFDRWVRWVEQTVVGRMTPEERQTLLFVTAPDAIDVHSPQDVVSHPEKTLEWAHRWLPWLRDMDLPTALVAQPGHERIFDEYPWDLLDAVFLGGSTEWKIGDGARLITSVAKRWGKHVHMGRVNSGRRLRLADSWGCDTADGTYLSRGPQKNLPNLLGWLDDLAVAA